jgi:hypothetical protein
MKILLTVNGCSRTSRSMLSSTHGNSRTQAITLELGNSVASNGSLLHHTRPVSNTTSVPRKPP